MTVFESHRMGLLAMVGASLCFSTGGLLIKMIPWNPLAINGMRTLIGGILIIWMARW